MCEPELPAECLRSGDYELKRIYLLHRFQGSGIGRMLLNEAIRIAVELCRSRLLLGVYRENRDAIRFYEKFGFVVIGERMFNIGKRLLPDLVMARNID